MSLSNISNLPFDGLLLIYNFCDFSDLLNLAQVSKSFQESVNRTIWRVVHVTWASIADDSFKQRNLNNMKYTSTLRICGRRDLSGRPFAWDAVRVNLKSMLDRCDPANLLSLEVNGVIDDEGLDMICTTLTWLREISLSRCKRVHNGWQRLNMLPDLKRVYVDKCLVSNNELTDIHAKKLQELKLVRCARVTDNVFEQLTALPSLRKLDLSFPKSVLMKEFKFKNVSCMLRLNELTLRGLRIDDEILKDLANIATLKSLALQFDVNVITDDGFAHLAQLTALEKVSLARCNHVSDSGFAPLAQLPALHTLNLNHCRKLSSVGAYHVSTLPSLTNIDVSNCPVSDDGFKHLCNVTSLKGLNLLYCAKITDNGLHEIRRLRSLQTLHTGGRKINLTDQGLSYICELTTLQHLDMNCCMDLTDSGMSCLTDLTNLRSLNVSNCSYISNAGLLCLANLNELRVLDLSGLGKITDNGLYYINRLPFLTDLNISYCSLVSDNGLVYINKMARLRKLTLIHCSSISDYGLSRLSSLTQLRDINVSNCRYVTVEGILHLCALPSLREVCLVDCSMVNMPELSDYPHIHFFGDNGE